MRTFNALYFATLGIQVNLVILLLGTLLSLCVFTYTNVFQKKISTSFTLTLGVSNSLLTLAFLALGFLFFINFACYLASYTTTSYLALTNPQILFKSLLIFEFSFCSFAINLYGYIIIFLALFVGFFALLVSENKIKSQNLNFFFYFNYFLLVVYLFVSINDVLGLFICYELLVLPSFFFVYFISYTRKALQASLYFIVWTQVGSLLVLIGCLYLINLTGDSSFSAVRHFHFQGSELLILYLLFFFGFGFKFPIWPFHYWLTKTHVEAPSGFSIYLSGFLVKSALFGFFTLTNLFCAELNTALFGVVAFLGAIDASLKMWGQSDLKKLVAYCTIQEMNLIVVAFLLGDTKLTMAGIMFSAAHAFLSTLMFYLVDCIYRRTHSRNVYQVQGLLHRTPNLGIAIFIMCVLYAGLPGTIKFSCEFFIFSALSESSLLTMMFLLFIMNVLGLIGFSKPWFNAIFGLPSKEMQQPLMDLSRRELYIICYPIVFFVFFTYLALPTL